MEIPATDAQGHFYLPQLAAGTYILQASAEGFEMQTQRTAVDPGKTTQTQAASLSEASTDPNARTLKPQDRIGRGGSSIPGLERRHWNRTI